jgi:1,4-dihydroxy-2-naphthoate octaprenyltransferase
VISALLGGLVAVVHGGVRLNTLHFILVALAAACTHAAANLMNDYFDHRKGVDRPETLGSSGVINEGLMRPREILIESLVFWALSALLAIYFLIQVGTVLLPLLIVGFVAGAGYTAAPTQLKYRALGDLAVFVAFGVGITLGSYAVQTGHLSWVPVAYSLPVSFLVAAILHGNNLRDMDSDRAASITTLAMLLGPVRGWVFYLALLLLAYLSLVVFVASSVIVPFALIALISAPIALQIARRFGQARTASTGATGGNPPGVALARIDLETARLHMLFGVLLLLGMLARIVF